MITCRRAPAPSAFLDSRQRLHCGPCRVFARKAERCLGEQGEDEEIEDSIDMGRNITRKNADIANKYMTKLQKNMYRTKAREDPAQMGNKETDVLLDTLLGRWCNPE